jgi:hypothetical protein
MPRTADIAGVAAADETAGDGSSVFHGLTVAHLE